MRETIPHGLGHALRGARAGYEPFALDRKLDVEHPPGRATVVAAMAGRGLAKGGRVGTYQGA